MNGARRAGIALAALLLFLPARAGADSLMSLGDVEQAILNARSVTVSAYTLSPNARLLRDLDSAAARGARVDLILTSDGFDYALSQNRAIVDGGHRFHVGYSRGPLHLKMAVIDGHTVILTDRNFAREAVYLHLPDDYAQAVERAAAGDPHSYRGLTLTKGQALAAEARLIDQARTSVSLSTESFGPGNAVVIALAKAVVRHVHVSIRTNSTEGSPEGQALLDAFARAGATITSSTTNEKLALVDNRLVFASSANATAGLENQVEWGYVSSTPSLVAAIAGHLSP